MSFWNIYHHFSNVKLDPISKLSVIVKFWKFLSSSLVIIWYWMVEKTYFKISSSFDLNVYIIIWIVPYLLEKHLFIYLFIYFNFKFNKLFWNIKWVHLRVDHFVVGVGALSLMDSGWTLMDTQLSLIFIIINQILVKVNIKLKKISTLLWIKYHSPMSQSPHHDPNSDQFFFSHPSLVTHSSMVHTDMFQLSSASVNKNQAKIPIIIIM